MGVGGARCCPSCIAGEAIWVAPGHRTGRANKAFVGSANWGGVTLPDDYQSPSTGRRRLKRWDDQVVWLNAWRALLGALDVEGL